VAPPVAPPTVQRAASPVAIATPSASEQPRELSVTRFSTRDYTYVQREIRRILLLASAIFVVIVVLSFFLP
jgi:hypothetical protein